MDTKILQSWQRSVPRLKEILLRLQYQNKLLAWLQEKCPIENYE